MSHAVAYTLSIHPQSPLSRVLTRVAATWEMRRRTRRDLRQLTGHMLRDIGLDQYDAAQEVAKPFWRA